MNFLREQSMTDSASPANPSKKIFKLHPNVFFLGLTSLLNDFSSELIFTLLPLFLTNILGASTVVVGLIGGISGSADSLFRIASGWYSDKIGNRKRLAVTGYAISTLAKPFMYIAASWGAVTGIRFTDRMGKGIRNAPRDALVADSVSSEERGRGLWPAAGSRHLWGCDWAGGRRSGNLPGSGRCCHPAKEYLSVDGHHWHHSRHPGNAGHSHSGQRSQKDQS
jgi:hypothetical protein